MIQHGSLSPKILNSFLVSIVLIITFYLYLPSLANGFTNWDDNILVTNNTAIQNLSWNAVGSYFDLHSARRYHHYHPLVVLSFAVEYYFFGLDSVVFHSTNLFLHCANTILIFWLIWKLRKDSLISFLGALLFGIHPLHVESVAWVTERKDVLFSFWYLLALMCYVDYLQKNRMKGSYALAVLFFLMSLLSKAMAITLPLVLFLIDYHAERKFSLQTLKEKIPFFLLSILFAVLAAVVEHPDQGLYSTVSFSWFDSIFIACHGLLFYLGKLIIPLQLSSRYPSPLLKGGWLPWDYLVSPIIVVTFVLSIVVRRKTSRSVKYGTLFFLATILPVLQFVPVGNATVANRFVYLSSAGFFYCVADRIAWVYRRFLRLEKYYLIPAGILFMVIVSSYGYATYTRCKVWKDSITLWTDVLNKNPDDTFALNNRAIAYLDIYSVDEALSDLDRAVAIDSTFALSYNNRGLVYLSTYRSDSAMINFDRALAIRPNFTLAWYNRGNAFALNGNFKEAIENFSHALILDPNFDQAYNNRANAYARMKEFPSALADYKRAIRIDPTNADVYTNQAFIYLEIGNRDLAFADFDRAADLRPRRFDVYIRRGLTRLMFPPSEKGQKDSAIIDLKKALHLNPSFAKAYCSSILPYFTKGLAPLTSDDLKLIAGAGYNVPASVDTDLSRGEVH